MILTAPYLKCGNKKRDIGTVEVPIDDPKVMADVLSRVMATDAPPIEALPRPLKVTVLGLRIHHT